MQYSTAREVNPILHNVYAMLHTEELGTRMQQKLIKFPTKGKQ